MHLRLLGRLQPALRPPTLASSHPHADLGLRLVRQGRHHSGQHARRLRRGAGPRLQPIRHGRVVCVAHPCWRARGSTHARRFDRQLPLFTPISLLPAGSLRRRRRRPARRLGRIRALPGRLHAGAAGAGAGAGAGRAGAGRHLKVPAPAALAPAGAAVHHGGARRHRCLCLPGIPARAAAAAAACWQRCRCLLAALQARAERRPTPGSLRHPGAPAVERLGVEAVDCFLVHTPVATFKSTRVRWCEEG